ncbi:MAG: hypothetical protein Q9198_009903, partial [Flavoplaca austrocitrina]
MAAEAVYTHWIGADERQRSAGYPGASAGRGRRWWHRTRGRPSQMAGKFGALLGPRCHQTKRNGLKLFKGQYSAGTLDLDRINRQLFPFLKVTFLPQIIHNRLDGTIEVFEDEDARQDAEPAPAGARLISTQRWREAQES